MVPGQELVDFGDLVVWDAGERVGEPDLGVDAVELGRLDQGVGRWRRRDRRPLSPRRGSSSGRGPRRAWLSRLGCYRSPGCRARGRV